MQVASRLITDQECEWQRGREWRVFLCFCLQQPPYVCYDGRGAVSPPCVVVSDVSGVRCRHWVTPCRHISGPFTEISPDWTRRQVLSDPRPPPRNRPGSCNIDIAKQLWHTGYNPIRGDVAVRCSRPQRPGVAVGSDYWSHSAVQSVSGTRPIFRPDVGRWTEPV